jgi:PAS domain S-box-containing protein
MRRPKNKEAGQRTDPEAAQGQDEMRFRRLVEKLPAAAYICDASGLITFFNRQAAQLWGREPKLNHPADRFCGSFRLYAADGKPIEHDQSWMALALRNRQDYSGQEIIIEREGGGSATVLANASPFYDDAGRLIGALNILVDISDRKRAEEAQARLAAIVESSDDAIVSKTLDGIIVSWNGGAERLFGYSAREAIGSPITLIIPPELREEELRILERLRRGERIDHFETVRVDKNGRRIDISLTISPIRDGSGRIIGSSKVARDITARRETDRRLLAVKDELASQLTDLGRLHEMSLRLSTTLELQPILDETLRTAIAIGGADKGLLSIYDRDEEHLVASASWGFTDGDMARLEELPPDARVAGVCFRQRRRVVVEDIETDPLFEPCRAAAQAAGFRAVHCTPIATRQGEMIGVLCTHFRHPHRPAERETRLSDLCARQAADFIENARLYARLREADQRKDEFLATLAHELRNPLAPISNSLHLLRLSGDLDPAVSRVREIMERQVSHLVRLVDDLLEVSRITRGKIELRKETVELAGIIDGAVETTRPLIESSAHQLAISVPPEPITVSADPLRLMQVVANLLTNAAKYTDRGGQIWLTARREGDEAVVSVRDTGLGIPHEMLSHVFDMFSQVDRTLNRSQGGLGIGLTLAKSFVQMHGGSIEARSEGPGQGSEFIVRLPVMRETPRPRLDTPAAPFILAPLPPRTVLVVDDEPSSAFTLGKLLELMGQRVRTANDGAAALAEIQANRPDVVISDIAMPHMDGFELAKRVREIPEFNGVTLVALTGYGQESDRRQAQEAGFNFHLVKPVGLAALQELLGCLPASPAADAPRELPFFSEPTKSKPAPR